MNRTIRKLTLEQSLESEKRRLRMLQVALRQSTDVDERIECYVRIGRCTQYIRRLERRLRGEY